MQPPSMTLRLNWFYARCSNTIESDSQAQQSAPTSKDDNLETSEHLLSDWQIDFVNRFAASTAPKNALIAGVGQGKSVATIHAAIAKLNSGQAKKVAFLSDMQAIATDWIYRANSGPITIDRASPSSFSDSSNGAALTFRLLEQRAIHDSLIDHASTGDLLVIVDEADRYLNQAAEVADRVLESNPKNQILFISRTPLAGQSETWKYQLENKHRFDREYILEPKTLILPSTQILLAQHSPSLTLLAELHRRTRSLDELGWREFEILISELLASDGYEIELMSGTKDGGVDIVAVKDLGETGMFKALWQAKKNRTSRKVGIPTIRELADVRNQHQASKGIIVTTSFLTRGALERVERERFILGKVDNDDLKAWIERKLYE
ncbi:hypothetical protein PHLH7_31440 [Pseudomonas sp. Ost2]|nr:hypothetical protein PHLH7_31440 [Pseudomonas sp. Ost2]